MAFRHVHVLMGAIVFLATMVPAPYPLVTIGASEIIADILGTQYGKSHLLGSAVLFLPFSISTVGHVIGSFLFERYHKGNDGFLGSDTVLVPLSVGLVIDVEVRHVDT